MALGHIGGPSHLDQWAGDLIVAELCSWGCDKAMEVLEQESLIDEQNAMVSMRQTLEQDLGRLLLRAIRGAKDGTARFVVPVGSEEVHVEMCLKPLNPRVRPDEPYNHLIVPGRIGEKPLHPSG